MCGPLFIPIINVLTLRLPCMLPAAACFSTLNSALAIASLAGGILFAVLCILLSATYFTRFVHHFSGCTFMRPASSAFNAPLSLLRLTTLYSDPTAQHPLARSSSRVVVAQLLLRLVLTVTFPLLQLAPSLKWLMIVMYTLGCASVAALYTWYLPVRSPQSHEARLLV